MRLTTTVEPITQRSEWLASWFDSFHYHKLYAHRDEAEAGRFLDALIARLNPGRDDRVLDLGCGAGRHAKYLASKGLRVTGIDQLFERAKAAGALVLAEPADHMYGERQCSFVDPWGRPWTLSETIFDSDPSDWGGELLVE